jgi:hypothetical protein
MALEYASSSMDVKRSAETIMNTLPICSVRKISYSTFTIVDIDGAGETRIIEYDNPRFLLLRDGREEPVAADEIALERWSRRTLRYSRFHARPGDRIVFFSDGVTQAGMGERATPLGWGRDSAVEFVRRETSVDWRISARDLAARLVEQAGELDGGEARDDTTAGVIYFRQPRRLLVVTGPPFARARDWELGDLVENFSGAIAICGGATANIVSRQLGREIRMDLSGYDPEIPPAAAMTGVDLITEGALTLGRAAALLENGGASGARENAATRLVSLLLASDVVQFAVGTRINEAHQDPNIPVELDLRRNVVKKIAALLEEKYMKEVHVQYR